MAKIDKKKRKEFRYNRVIVTFFYAGIFEIPNVEAKRPADDAIPLTIICDNVREPGNLGSIIRIAAAVGCEKLLLMKGIVAR